MVQLRPFIKGPLANLLSKMDRQLIGLPKPTVFGSFLRPLRNQDRWHWPSSQRTGTVL